MSSGVNELWLRNSWVSEEGSANLGSITAFINSKEVEHRRLDPTQSFESALLQKEFDDQAADDHAETGGSSLKPNLFILSFPGTWRGFLFRCLKIDMKLRLDESGDVHLMNNTSRGSGLNRKKLRKEWFKEFGQLSEWKDFTEYVESVVVAGKKPYSKKGTGPAWFVDNWGLAAWNVMLQRRAGKASKALKGGLICLVAWFGYLHSPWCKMEYLFARCLASAFPGAVYIADPQEGGHYLTKGEPMPEFKV